MNLKHIAGEARVQICDYFTGNSVITLPQEQALLDSIILTAAAKMVRESGAVEALERAGCWVPTNAVDTKKALTHPVHECRTLAQVDAALQSLRALTEHKGEA